MNIRFRRTAATLAAGLLVAGLVEVSMPASSSAADPIDFQVVGTTDVSDSGLIDNVIKKDFEAAYPNVKLTYTPQGTGAAITSAKTGNFSALVVHAASLENAFVAGGYSADNSPGRAIFWGDYVLLGPASDPAGVMSGGQPSHDAADAFEKIAAAGVQKKADFVSRGGTPGTTVQEHAIWKLTGASVPKCAVADDGKQGGGAAPSDAATAGTTCAGTDMARSYPDWYHVNSNAGQAANIGIGNACQYPNSNNGAKLDCYVFTDRGTFNYLQSQGQAGQLQIVARDNDSAARGNSSLLVNSFHAYAIKHNSGDKVDEATAKLFLDFVTSAGEQAKIGNYLGSGRSAAFIPSAAPFVSSSALPTAVPVGTAMNITGSINNAVPGTPALDGVNVTLRAQTNGGVPTDVGTVATNATGGFAFSVVAGGADTTYTLATPQITKVEDATLSPPFSDVLVASSSTLGTVRSLASAQVTVKKRKLKHRKLKITGALGPAAQGAAPTITVFGGRPGRALVPVKAVALPLGATAYALRFKLPKGKTRFEVVYASGSIVTAVSRVLKIRVH